MRLQKYLSRAGVASRRASEGMIEAGRVRVNGVVVKELGVKVDPAADVVEVDGARVEEAAPVWIALHKPAGYVCTRRDRHGRRTIYDLVPAEYEALFHVGRLDLESEGLVLLTNQGGVANRLLHPRYQVDRVYEVAVKGRVTQTTLRRLLAGVVLEDGPAHAHVATMMEVQAGARAGAVGSRLQVTMREGRKREVRRMLEVVGHPVLRLVRLRLGPVELGDLAPGAWRLLGDAERAELRRFTERRAAGPRPDETERRGS
ncbi:MAG: pseudouridine synthase [Gemmatimonadota bacterium]|jgi:23S rRNA pseudouridine2605 synthase